MISTKMAERICQDWIKAWNDRNLDALVTPFSDDIELTSPMVVKLFKLPMGTIKGKDMLREYFSKGLEAYADFKFESLAIFAGMDSVMLQYRGVDGSMVADYFALDYDGLIKKAVVHYQGKG